MARKTKGDELKKVYSIDEDPDENVSCEIVIKCAPPSGSGEMSVEMSVEGDRFLASYLLDQAKDYVEAQIRESME